MGGYSYKKRNKAVKQSFKNRRSSPQNINIMVGGEEPIDEDLEMVGGAIEDDIKAGFAAIDNYFKMAFITKDVNRVYIEKDGLNVELLNRVQSTVAASQSGVNMNVKIALSISNVIQKAYDVLNAVRSNSTQQPPVAAGSRSKKGAPKSATDTNAIAAINAAKDADAASKSKNQFVQPEVVSVITATLNVIPYGVDTVTLTNLTAALTNLTATLNELPNLTVTP